MESSTSYVTTKDGFEVILNKTDTELIIEAEDQGSGTTFSAKFANDAIKTMSLDLFESIPELFEGLITAFEGISEDTIVKVTQKGKLLFTQKLKIGKHEKVFNFPIPLKLVEVDPLNRLEKQVRKLFREIEDVKKENQQLKEKLTRDCEMISPNFNTSDTFSSQFDISQDKKQVTKNAKSSGNHMPLGSEKKLSQQKNSKFQVKLDYLYGTVAIGVATKDVTRNQNFLSSSGSYCIATPNNIYENTSSKAYTNYSNLTTGSIVGVSFIPNQGEILFDINGTHVSTVKIDASHQKVDLYPFISLSNNGAKVSFI